MLAGNSAEDDRQDGHDDHQLNEREPLSSQLRTVPSKSSVRASHGVRWRSGDWTHRDTSWGVESLELQQSAMPVTWLLVRTISSRDRVSADGEGATQQSLVVVRPCSSANFRRFANFYTPVSGAPPRSPRPDLACPA